ncbi:uncharacterized protein LOC114929730 [Nylanderia fulva]|uniref:uncharacterized protein LOC114929730 n=1 Tax=Nylanderia fulva TaxID=613905 RepID=UPI0010FB72CF|nr:uncharacterized protein LOC114929730 [Nylanderia fulva]
MSEPLAQQIILLQTIERSLTNFKKIGKNNYTAAKIRQRIGTLKENWTTCVNKHANLVQIVPLEQRANISYFRDAEFERHQEIYEGTLDYMADCLEELEPAPSMSSSPLHPMSTIDRSSFSLTHLPPIKLPPFSGNLDEWESFRDRFTSLIIQNQDLTPFSRMHFLASSLTGRALDTIKSIPITATNFEIAWKTLASRFDNKRRLVEVHVSALFDLPTATRESACELNKLRDKANRAIASLRALQRSPEEMLSDILVHCVSQKLDHATRKAWRLKTGEDPQIPLFEALDRFLEMRVRALEELSPSKAEKMRGQKVSSASATVSKLACPLCQAAHFLSKCPQFLKKTPSQRSELIKSAHRCINCLSSKHAVQACPSKYSCRICQNRHHSMLHSDSTSSSSNPNSTTVLNATSDKKENDSVTALFSTSTVTARKNVLLATARVAVFSPSGRTLNVRALLDQGSEITFITERLAQNLKLQRVRLPLSISAVGGVDAGTCRFAAQVKIAPINSNSPVLTTTASILKVLTKYSPSKAFSLCDWSYLQDLALADPTPVSAESIDLIIGADLYPELLLDGIRKGTSGQPIAQRTIFGWVLSGPTSDAGAPHRSVTVQHCASADNLDRELRCFWEVEEVPRRALLSPEEQQCEQHFAQTHSRDADGRYVVRLPFRRGPPIDIGESRFIAERSLSSLHRRFRSNAVLKSEYVDFLREYEALGHMRQIPDSVLSAQHVYIPHHPVIRDSSLTTRLRVVFNASSRTTNSTSLNDHLHAGPKLQTELPAVILRWRQFRYVYAADIAKMYRQIRVDSRDIDFQRILWSAGCSDTGQSYQLTTVTYGTACAPFLALRVIQQLVTDEGSSFPLAAPVLHENIYVDDVLFGADDIPLLKQTRDQVCALLGRGRFELRKWSSNSAALLNDIEVDNHGLACDRTLRIDEHLRILGISWSPSSDMFHFTVTHIPSVSKTKRSILSYVAKLFDPMGWCTPVTIAAKIFMQQLWQLKLNWDDVLPTDVRQKWEALQASLADLHGLQLNRWIQRGSDTVRCELHGFSDASTHAYAAAVYLRLTSLSGEISSHLLIGKSKVAPIKSLSIPRLELCAAGLLARLLEFVRTTLGLATSPCYCWTDSTVVLAWVTQQPAKWKTFVANRVSEIQSRVPNAVWNHVPTDENPAHCASRGIAGSLLRTHPLWWCGPAWLRNPIDEPSTSRSHNFDTQIEQKESIQSHLASTELDCDFTMRFSSWPRLIRVTAYIMRFINKTRKQSIPVDDVRENTLALSARECQLAKEFVLRRIQKELFPLEFAALTSQRAISSKSSILSLNPFLGEDGLIRVGGRLSHAPLSFSVKHPIILASHPLVALVLYHVHLKSLHAGLQLTLATLRREYWVLRARSLAKLTIFRCVICTRERATIPFQQMGDLPRVRVTPPARAFLNCGLDYAGPVLVRSLSGRGIPSRKAYIAIFICMATRAIHLELVEGYSTSAFIGAFSRFCARRGLPSAMYSDNGTNFVGAERELTAAFRAAIRDPDFLNRTASDRITWHFMPPSAPHFGGLWEAGVRSVKHHLRRVIGAHTLTFEEFSTVLCNVEACLNSRRLAPLNDSVDDYEPLTPGHFLIGSALTAVPEPSVLNLRENRLSRWQLVRQISERFWKLWLDDYVNTLQQRVKWKRPAKTEIRVGQLVLLRNPLLPPCKWELARVLRCHTGQDGLTRVVTVKTAASEYKRPINKLCLLPIDIEKLEPPT